MMEKLKNFFKGVVLWGLLIIMLIWFANLPLPFLLFEKPEVLHFLKGFFIFSFIIQLWFCIDHFYAKYCDRVSLGWKDLVIVLLIIILGGLVIFIYALVWSFFEFMNNDKKVLVFLPTIFFGTFTWMLIVVYEGLSVIFFAMTHPIRKQKTLSELIKTIK